MSFNRLVSSLRRGIWLIDAQTAELYAPFILKILTGEQADIPNYFKQANNRLPKLEGKTWEEKMASQAIELGFYLQAVNGKTGKLDRKVWDYDDMPEGSVAVIPNLGPMQKEDGMCGEMGTSTMRRMLDFANQSEKIVGHILHSDSPGGHVDGTEALGKALANSEKPTVTYVDGMTASAGYWALSQTNYAIASGRTDMIGSIGTMISLIDVIGMYEKQGAKYHEVYADDSKDKNKTFRELLKGNYEPIKKELLNPTNDAFLAAVKSGRPGISDEVLTGKTWLSEQALERKLIDGIGSFQDAVAKVNELSGQKTSGQKSSKPSNNPQTQISEPMKFKSAWTALMSAIGLAPKAFGEEAPAVSEEHLDQLNAKVEELQGSNKSLESQVSEKDKEIAALKAEKAKLEEEKTATEASLKTSNEEVAKLKAQAPVQTRPQQDKSDAIDSSDEEDPFTDDYDFNQKAKEFGLI